MKHYVGQTQNGLQVYAYLTGSKVSARLSRQPRLLTLAREMLAAVTLREPEICMEYNMQRQIGYDFTISTTDEDVVFYARLLKDDIYTRFVKNGEPLPTNYLTLTLLQDSDENYELSDLWIGHFMPPRPGSTDEVADSKLYWSRHAFILADQPLQTQTITKICPY